MQYCSRRQPDGDMMDSRQDEVVASQLAKELISLFQKCAMKIAKFYSNSKKVMESVPANLRLAEAENLNETWLGGGKIVPKFKALGVEWEARG